VRDVVQRDQRVLRVHEELQEALREFLQAFVLSIVDHFAAFVTGAEIPQNRENGGATLRRMSDLSGRVRFGSAGHG